MRKRKNFSSIRGVLTIFLLLIAVFIGMCVASDSFRSLYNINNLIIQCVPLTCVALGQTIVIIASGIDLSVGSTISVCTTIAGKLMNTDNPAMLTLAVLAVIGTGLLVGLLNGIGINYLKVPPLITTLCMGTILNGIALWIMPMAGGSVNKQFAKFIYRKWNIISMPLIIMLILYVVLRHILYYTKTGIDFYAIGKGREIASTMGVPVRKASIKAYVMCGFCAGLTGLLLACRMRVGDPTVGANYSMDSITAAVIGGTSMAGGTGLLAGTIGGAFLIGMLSNIMNNLAVNQFYQYVLKGSLLVVAMVIYSISNFLEMKRNEKQ